MALQPVVLEISSDEEEVGTQKSLESFFDWAKIFGPIDGQSGERGDVVVVDKLSCAAPVQRQNPLPTNAATGVPGDDSDDDCKVLDGDPNYKVDAVQDNVDGSGDLVVVGENCLLACRDYPHARYLCAKFPFSTTPHESYCNLCHCYVCDSLAPCLYWGNGMSSADHCHSSDKEERWKVQRRSLKTRNGETAHPQKVSDCTSLVNRGRITSFPRPPGSHLAPSPTQIRKSYPLRASSAASFGLPNIISQRHRSAVHDNLRSCQQINRHSGVIPGMRSCTRYRRPSGAAFGHRGISAPTKFKPSASGFANLNAIRQQFTDTGHIQMNATMETPNNQHPPVPSQSEILGITSQDVCLSEFDSEKLQHLIRTLESDLGLLQNSNTGEVGFPAGVTVSLQPELFSHSSSEVNRSQNAGRFVNSAPAMPEVNMLEGIWPDGPSVNVLECSSVGNLEMQADQPSNHPVVSERNPASEEEDPLGKFLASLEPNSAPDVAKDPAFPEVDSSTFMFDFESFW